MDKALVMPYQDTLVSLMNAEDFRDIVGTDIWRRMDFIRRMGNNALYTEYIHFTANSIALRQLRTQADGSICRMRSAEMATEAIIDRTAYNEKLETMHYKNLNEAAEAASEKK